MNSSKAPIKLVERLFQPFIRIHDRYRKEAITYDNLLLNNSEQLGIVFIFSVMGILGKVLSPIIQEAVTERGNSITDLPIFILMKSIAFLFVAYIMSIRFRNIQTEGQLGYWLTLGIERKEFLVYVILTTSLVVTLGLFQSYLLISVFTAVLFDVTQLLEILILSIISIILVMNLSLLLTDLIDNKQISFLLLIIIFLIISEFSSSSSIVFQLLFPEVISETIKTAIISGVLIILNVIIFWVNLRGFRMKNIELGG